MNKTDKKETVTIMDFPAAFVYMNEHHGSKVKRESGTKSFYVEDGNLYSEIGKKKEICSPNNGELFAKDYVKC